jgi:hypothetical protein
MAPGETARMTGERSVEAASTMDRVISRLLVLKAPTAYFSSRALARSSALETKGMCGSLPHLRPAEAGPRRSSHRLDAYQMIIKHLPFCVRHRLPAIPPLAAVMVFPLLKTYNPSGN